MSKSEKLIIVESPTKAKTISRFLDSGFLVESSYGHVRDLPKSSMGVDMKNGFEPNYVVATKAKKRVTELKELAKKATEIYYATDEDREGEAIAWHLDYLFGHPKNTKRIAFHEITKQAILEALKNPRKIDLNLVNAQQARRILDRLVGYELSPFLWKKVAKGLSAGRVQSVAVRLIVEREREIKAFKVEEYWTIEAVFSKDRQDFNATLFATPEKERLEKFDIKNEEQAQGIVQAINNSRFLVKGVEEKESFKTPPTPLTTSTLQQRANRMLGFSAKQTMVLAQQLYEGVDLGPEGITGLITYMRTDSLNLAEQFLAEAQRIIKEKFGPAYASGPKKYQAKSKLAQEAHEPIRPTNPALEPSAIKEYLDSRQFKLYDSISSRSLASQMPPARVLNTSIDLKGGKGHLFRATGSVIIFDGFLKVLPRENDKNILPKLKEGDQVDTKEIKPIQHFTEPPARYSEAALIKALEEYGVGRPSTYAPTIATIQGRNYVTLEEKKLKPTDIAFVVNDLLVEHFPKVVDYQFTAKIEDDFDEIADGKLVWNQMIGDFYGPFHENIKAKEETVTRAEVTAMRELGKDPASGEPIYVRLGRYGPFVQKGEGKNKEKPVFAPLGKNQSLETVTLEDALKLFQLPRHLGKTEAGEEVTVNRGRFGPYAKIGDKNYSLGDKDPFEITLDEALAAIKEVQEKKGKKEIKEFPEKNIKVLSGRYGPYITDGVKNAKIPADLKPENLSLEECQELLAKAPERKRRGNWKKKP